MQPLEPQSVKSILCLGAHADDIEIGCGGTLLEYLERNPMTTVYWVVFSSDSIRRGEAIASAEAFLGSTPKPQVIVESFRDAYFPAQWEAIKDRFGSLAKACDPDLIFTHRLEDRHQDHRVIAELTWNHFRDHLILEYEIPKLEGDLSTPNVYVPISEASARKKVQLLDQCFPSQRQKPWFCPSTFESLMRIRALESATQCQWAEGFYGRKLTLLGNAPRESQP